MQMYSNLKLQHDAVCHVGQEFSVWRERLSRVATENTCNMQLVRFNLFLNFLALKDEHTLKAPSRICTVSFDFFLQIVFAC